MWEETLTDSSATDMQEDMQEDQTPTEFSSELMHDIQLAVGRLASKADRLIRNFTTNLAENWMQIRCKFDGGKVVNRSQSGSWEHRCSGAGLQKNLGKSWGPTMWERMTGHPANEVFTRTAESSAKRAEKDRERKSKQESKDSRRRAKYSQNDNSVAARKAYSRHDDLIEPDDIISDITPEELEAVKESFYATQVAASKEDIANIEECTREQGGCDVWKKERIKRITASNVGSISKMKKTTKRCKKVKELLYSTFRGNKATMYGTLMEDKARQEYIEKQQENGHPGLTTEQSGLVISTHNPWLAASPDGRVQDPNATPSQGLVEYKNPFSMKDLTIEEAAENKTFCLEKKEKGGQIVYSLKRKHNYFYQVQMYCCSMKWCDFVVRTEKDIHIERIHEDKKWWSEQMPKLKSFYFDALLPELASPRQGKGGIREPQQATS